MRILSLSPTPFWDVEDRKGMPSIYLTHESFAAAGHEVLFAFPGRKSRTYDYNGIRICEFVLPFRVAPERFIWLHRLTMQLHWFVFVAGAMVKGLKLCRNFKPDVIYAHFHYGAPVGWILGRLFSIPNVTRMYGTFLFPWVHSFWGRVLRWQEVLGFKVPCSYLIMTNDGTRGDDVAAVLGVPPRRLKFWRNGVNKNMYDTHIDQDAFRDSLAIPRDHKVILAVSRLVAWKRVDRLLTAMPEVLRKYPDVTVVVVGDGHARPDLERLCGRLRIEDHVRFVGLVAHEEVSRFLNPADVFVSLYELSNAGNPMLEALACGKCIVSINNGGTGQINEFGEVAVLLEESELSRLPDVLVSLLQDGERRKRLGLAARQYAMEHLETWEDRVQMETRLIEELVAVSAVRMQSLKV